MISSTYGLCNSLAKQPSLEVKVLCTDSAGPGLHASIDSARSTDWFKNYEVTFCKRWMVDSVAPGLLPRMAEFIKRTDVVHLCGVYGFPTIPALIFSKLFGRPLVWSTRGSLQATHIWNAARRRKAKFFWESVCRNIIGNNPHVVFHATSDAEQKVTQSLFPKQKVVVIPNGIEIPESQRTLKPSNNQFNLLFVGRLDPIKGLEQLFSALRSLGDSSLRLTICGEGRPGYTNHLKNLVSSSSLLAKTVSFRGHVIDLEKQAAFLSADICILPSINENFGNVVAEALSYGIPVIASKGTPWSHLEIQRCGLWVENSPEKLADAIRFIREQPITEWGNRGRAWMMKEFSWESVSASMCDLYHNI
jgi:glycosyltransferase involved in cell wall biosynthesis